MNRRSLLSLLAAAASAVTGCLDDASGGTPSLPESCPSFADDATTVCAHDASGDEPVGFTASARTLAPMNSIAFELTNRSNNSLGMNPYQWTVYRRRDDDWTHVAPDAYPEPWLQLDPDETHEWTLTLGDGGGAANESIELSLESGIYAFVKPCRIETGDDAGSYECVAVFRVET